MARKYTPVGSFKMEGDVMRVSDPCYKKDVWCAGTIHNCKIGDWETAVVLSDEGQFGVRVAMLVAYHCDSGVSFSLADKILSDGRFVPGTGFEHCDFEVGVDSACAGLYDDSKFGLDEVFADAPPAPEYYGNGQGAVWYSHCCCATDTSCGLESSPAALSPTVGLAMEATMPIPTQAGMAKLTLWLSCILPAKHNRFKQQRGPGFPGPRFSSQIRYFQNTSAFSI